MYGGDKKESLKKDSGYEMVNVDFDESKSVKQCELIEAAKSGDLIRLQKCLDSGDNIREIGEQGGTVLFWAANNDNHDKALNCSREILNRIRLCSTNDDVIDFLNIEDKLNQTALTSAIFKGNSELVEILLDYGAKPNFNFLNETLFHYLASSDNHEKSLECALILLNKLSYDQEFLKTYLNTERKVTKRTALHIAASVGNYRLMEILIKNNADPTKVDYSGLNVLHHAVDNVFQEDAVNCTKKLMEKDLTSNWGEIIAQLIHTYDNFGKCPVHISARRGFHEVLDLLYESHTFTEGKTGYTPLHLSACLGNPIHAEACVKTILEHIPEKEKSKFLDAKDNEGCTPLYLSAKHRNVEACKLLLLAGSGFDIKTNHKKTPLEKVYEKIPQAVTVLLDVAVKNSGYIAYKGTINTYAELDFGPILGYNTSGKNIYKETEDLAKVCQAKFEDRKKVLFHPIIKVYIHKKWEMAKWFFHSFRLLHILWFFLNFLFLVHLYRVQCPFEGAKKFSWLSLRPNGDEEKNITSIRECEITQDTKTFGILNLIALLLYALSQFHQTKSRYHQNSIKPLAAEAKWVEKALSYTNQFFRNVYRILPCWPLFLGFGILFSTLPVFHKLPLGDETCHYILAGVMGMLMWIAIYFELGKFPRFRVYINLLIRSTTTLLWAIAVTLPILLGFATVFVVLMPGEASFSSAAQSFVKIITFMIGELNYEELFYGDDKESVFSGIVMLALAVFVVVIVLLLVNYLIGLAAEEISDFSNRAETWKLCTKLEQIVMLESFLDERTSFIGRNFLKKKLMLMPPEIDEDGLEKQKRQAIIYIPYLPAKLGKELHELNLKTIRIEK